MIIFSAREGGIGGRALLSHLFKSHFDDREELKKNFEI